jgi:hypothetical protein
MANPFVRLSKSSPTVAGLLSILLLVLVPSLALGDVNDRDRSRGKGKRTGNAALQQEIDFALIDVNRVLTIVDNRGIIGQDPRTGNGFGFFPANSPNNYVFGGGLWVGGIVNGTKIVSTAYDASGGFSEYSPENPILCSDDPLELAEFPAEFSDPATGEPIVFSQKDCVVTYRDNNQARDITTPIGLEVGQRTMVFTFGDLSQVMFIVWDIENTGTNTVSEAFTAVDFDMDIGDTFTDDRCSAIPFVPPGANNPGPDTAFTNLGFCWDNNFQETNFDPNPPGFIGLTFFQGPVSDAGDTLGVTRFTLHTNPSAGRPQPDPETDTEQYDLMAGIGARAPFIDAVAADVRFVEISGPITFAPGQTQRVVAGMIWANVSGGASALATSPTRCFPEGAPCFLPDPNDPALAELIRVQRAAQIIFDAGFLAPAPPPKPDITLIPGDQQVTVVWSDVSQEPDPFFAIAGDPTSPAFDPTFREFDFEGYVVVRSTSGDAADVDTLAIFDLANDVVTIVDTTFAQVTVVDTTDQDTIITEIATSTTTRIDLPNTGLQFSFVDQGLINGITYFYDVVPFDFNPSTTLRDVGSSLSAGISFQPRDVRAVRPRSNASSFLAATAQFVPLKADGTACDTEEPTATVDTLTGKYTDFIDCSNAIVQATLQPLRDVNIPSGQFELVIDSLTIDHTGDYDLDAFGGYNLAFTLGNRAWFHWEEGGGGGAAPAGAGALTTAIQPNVGSFDQAFTFFGAAETPVAFGLDTDPTDVGPDLSISLVVASDFSVIEDLEVNGQSVHLGELGGTHQAEARPHRVNGSSLADVVVIGNARNRAATAREYSHPGNYGQGGTSYELTWTVSGGQYSGTLRKLPGGEVVPLGGQPRGPENPSTPADFIAGYNWGFIAPGTPAEVTGAVFPVGGPLANSISLALGNTFAIMLPGQSVYIEGIKDLPDEGDRWTFLIDTGSQRALFGRDSESEDGPNSATPPFSYHDVNDAEEQGQVLSPVPFARGIVNVYPGARWRLTVSGGSNDPLAADLSQIKTVPNPYVANAVWDFSQDNQRIEFVNLPPQATIRIYTISGNLVRTIEHTNGSGTELWDLRTRFNLKAATGTYYWHVTTPDGETQLGLLSIIQNEIGAN